MSADRPFSVEYAKSGRSTCKDTKEKIPKGAMRVGRWMPARDEDSEPMTSWYSLKGFTNMLAKARKTWIESSDEIAGLSALTDEEQEQVQAAIDGVDEAKERIKAERAAKRKATAKLKAEKAEADGSPKKKVKKEKAAKKKGPEKPTLNPDLPKLEPGRKYKPKEVATILLAHVRSIPSMNRSLPHDDAVARTKLGGFIMRASPDCVTTGEFDLEGAFNEAVNGGLWRPKKRDGIVAVNPANQALVSEFEEYAGYAFKDSVFKGNNAMKATKAMAEVQYKITSGAALSKGKTKIPGVGKSTGQKIDQFLETGQIEALENYRSM